MATLRKIKLRQFQAIRALLVTMFWIFSHLQRCLHVALILFLYFGRLISIITKKLRFPPVLLSIIFILNLKKTHKHLVTR